MREVRAVQAAEDAPTEPARLATLRPLSASQELIVMPGEDTAERARQAVYDWLLGYRENENTVRSYARALQEWFRYCAGVTTDPLEARRALVDAFKAELFDRGLKPASVGQRLSALASFYRYCEDEELIRRSPVRNVRRPKLPAESTSTGLTREELNAFLAEARRRGRMTYSLMVLLALNGLRASEPLLAEIADLGSVRGHRTLAVERKGRAGTKVRVPLAPLTAQALDDWLEERAKHLSQVGQGSGLIFFAFRRGTSELRALDRRDVHRWVRSVARVAVPHKPTLHPHDLRHAFVTLALDAGVPLRDVQDSAGHASANTTRRYDRGRNNIDRHATYTVASYIAGAK